MSHTDLQIHINSYRISQYNYRLKAILNRCDLSEHLKLLIDLLCLISLGSLFQSLGAALQNDLSPYNTSLVLGSTNNRLSWTRDLGLHGLSYTVIKLQMYSGALLWKALKVSRSILKSILNWVPSDERKIASTQSCHH